jgi:elongation factor G
VPVLCGSSFKNIGVQPLLDAIVNYLPSPLDIKTPVAIDHLGKSVPIDINDKNMTALAFKIIHNEQKGPLVFVRVYSGNLEAKSSIAISNNSRNYKNITERVTKLLEIYADDFEEISNIQSGNIGVVQGLKNVKTGDTLIKSNDNRRIQLCNIPIPPPVFVRSIQVDSISEEKELKIALENLLREDPSLHISYNDETGQTLISGMGELHLEIAGERLLDTYKVKCRLGKVEISYRETIRDTDTVLTENITFDRDILGKKYKCDMEFEVSKPLEKEVEICSQINERCIFSGTTDSLQAVFFI